MGMIDEILDNDGQVKDNASPELKERPDESLSQTE